MADVTSKTGLTRGGLVFVALAVGADYDKVCLFTSDVLNIQNLIHSYLQTGLKDCGIETARGLARYGVGDKLLDAAQNMSEHQLTLYLVEWRRWVCNLVLQDPDGYIGAKYSSVARNLSDEFPNRTVLSNYTHPITSKQLWASGSHDELQISAPLTTANLGSLAGFCLKQFEWSPKQIHDKFKSLLWEGCCLRMLVNVSVPYMLRKSFSLTSLCSEPAFEPSRLFSTIVGASHHQPLQ